MMRTTILVTALLLSMLSASVVYAQRIELALVDGCPVINCEGMSSSMYTTTPKGNTEASLKTATADKKVYKRFAVYNNDNGTSSWSTAFTLCSGVSGGGWRLPTQRELMLIDILRTQLVQLTGIGFRENNYWSATEDQANTSLARIVRFNSLFEGTTGTYVKNRECAVRCVRDL